MAERSRIVRADGGRRRQAAAVAAAMVVIGGCGSSRDQAAREPVNTGLDALARGESGGSVAGSPADTAVDQETRRRLDLIAQAQRNGEVSVDGRPARSPRGDGAATREAFIEPAGGAVATGETAEAEPRAAAAVEAATPAPTPTPATREALVADLAARLREQAQGSSAPAGELLRLAALELIEPGAGGGVAPDPAAEASLTAAEKEFLAAWRELFAAARDGLTSTGDTGPLAAQVAALAERIQAAQPLRALDARLCLKVDGFGMYEEAARRAGGEVEAYVLQAGVRTRVIVYVELANFTSTPATRDGVEGVEVRLSQELRLYHVGVSGDTEVWSRPFQEVRDFSRRQRRDFYMTQVIDLPRNLGVGAYRLKVSISDRASGAIAEALVPIELVAEAPAGR